MSEAGKRLSNLLGKARPKGDRWHGIVGNFDGVIDVPNKPGWKYVRIPKAGTDSPWCRKPFEILS